LKVISTASSFISFSCGIITAINNAALHACINLWNAEEKAAGVWSCSASSSGNALKISRSAAPFGTVCWHASHARFLEQYFDLRALIF
jgi:hypothetical protein